MEEEEDEEDEDEEEGTPEPGIAAAVAAAPVVAVVAEVAEVEAECLGGRMRFCFRPQKLEVDYGMDRPSWVGQDDHQSGHLWMKAGMPPK